ncbi:hypothetical protein D5086_020458 [Populus alba]|uniref:Uncharacterized protein n=1 Tax=Populus alba TaxID=43335 RepID=A0ACC4BK48_POPAL
MTACTCMDPDSSYSFKFNMDVMIGAIYSRFQKQDNKQRDAFPVPFPPFPSVSVHLCCCSSGFADQEIKKALFALPGNVLNGLVTTGQPKGSNW